MIVPIAPRPLDEDARLDALHHHHILDTPPEQAFDDLVRLAALVCGTPVAEIAFVDAERQWSKAAVGIHKKEIPRDIAFCSYTILEPGLNVVADMRDDPRFASNPLVTGQVGVRFYADMPLASEEGHVLGTLSVIDFVPRTLTAEQEDALRMLGSQVTHLLRARLRTAEREHLLNDRERLLQEKEHTDTALALQKQELDRVNAELEALLTKDGLTGLYDHRAFQDCLVEEVRRARRYGTPLALILLDLDDFKIHNDTFGHPAGDEALRTVAQILQGGARETDMVARYGGEEFVLILPQTNGAGATVDAERLRLALENHPWPRLPLTASFGVATLRQGEDKAVLIARADKALYQAKDAGRNTVVYIPDAVAPMPLTTDDEVRNNV